MASLTFKETFAVKAAPSDFDSDSKFTIEKLSVFTKKKMIEKELWEGFYRPKAEEKGFFRKLF